MLSHAYQTDSNTSNAASADEHVLAANMQLLNGPCQQKGLTHSGGSETKLVRKPCQTGVCACAGML